MDINSCLSDTFVAVTPIDIIQVGTNSRDWKKVSEVLLLNMSTFVKGQVEKHKLFKCITSIRIKGNYT